MRLPAAKSEDFERVCQVFRDLFAAEFARISKVFREIPGLDTGHDGAELYLARSGWDVRGFPAFEDGHDGRWTLTLADRRAGQDLRFFDLQVLFKDEGNIILKYGHWDGDYQRSLDLAAFNGGPVEVPVSAEAPVRSGAECEDMLDVVDRRTWTPT